GDHQANMPLSTGQGKMPCRYASSNQAGSSLPPTISRPSELAASAGGKNLERGVGYIIARLCRVLGPKAPHAATAKPRSGKEPTLLAATLVGHFRIDPGSQRFSLESGDEVIGRNFRHAVAAGNRRTGDMRSYDTVGQP